VAVLDVRQLLTRIVGFLLLSEDQADASDIDPEHIHLIGADTQSNLKGVPVNIEVFHQLHCLVCHSQSYEESHGLTHIHRTFSEKRLGTITSTTGTWEKAPSSIQIRT
jgi:hypothetical protein